MEQTFVAQDSIVRQIWGQADLVLFIFAGAAAEFALNKQVDWLYFTGRLPKDPLGRMFSTISYAHRIIFMEQTSAIAAIQQINHIHRSVEDQRGMRIPDWAYRDVLYLLSYYSIRAFELLERKTTLAEQEEIFRVFMRMGAHMGIPDLPEEYHHWLADREKHLRRDLESSLFSSDLFLQYKRQLKPLRFRVMRQVQAWMVPQRVQELLLLRRSRAFGLLLALYKCVRGTYTRHCLLPLLMPRPYFDRVCQLNKQ